MSSVTNNSGISVPFNSETYNRATLQNKKVSDVVRDLIISGLTSSDIDTKVIEYLEGFGGILMALVFESAASRYFAEMALSYGIDMESLLRQSKPLDKEAKAKLLSQFEEAAMKNGQQTWTRILRMDQGQPDKG